jgi:dCTP deaminase
MILKANQIANRMVSDDEEDKNDPLVFAPFPNIDELKKSGAASIDLRLGTWFSTLRQSRIPVLEVDDELANAARKAGVTEDQLRIIEEFLPTSQAPSEANLVKPHYVSFGSRFILHPQSFVLGVTLEWMRLPSNLAGYVVGRSSWGRRGLIIATAAGVHPGFTGCLTLELTNVGEIPIAIKPGMTICQLFLHTVESKSHEIDRSPFVCSRRPTLGKIKLDQIAEKLARAKG